MKIFRFKTRIRIWHPQIGSDEITVALGIEPQPAVPRRRPVPPERRIAWGSETLAGEDSEILTVFENYLDRLESSAEFLENITRTGGRIEIFVGWFASKRSGGVEISHSLMKRFGDLHVGLSVDVYSTDEEPDDSDEYIDPLADDPLTGRPPTRDPSRI
jgi:hypothetical protein